MSRQPVSRRAVLGAAAGGVASLAGCSLLDRGGDSPTAVLDAERARELVDEYAPTLHFDASERWFPTDPRPYEREQAGETVVDGFDALDGYAERFGESPPDPTVFYRAVGYEGSPLAVVQFWFYSVFDQFTTNFHWHDWEVLHVFVDTDTGAPALYVASSHSRTVPNNEYLDPETRPPRILGELGSHSSALSVNGDTRFQRLPVDGADITNRALEAVEALAEIPAAYGLPRDEGVRLPYLVPELDGAPVYEHERLPSVGRDDLVPEALTVASFDALAAPPTDLPGRSAGLTLGPGGRGADAEYALVPAADLEHIDAFTGPQLSFGFAVPGFVEDAVAGHITTAGTPWSQPRYDNPAADITDPAHRAALADRYDAVGAPGAVGSVVAAVTGAVESPDAPDGKGLTTADLGVEAVALLESDPAAVPTFRGVALARGVPDGEHRLVVNGPGVAPHAETVAVEGTTAAGVGGEIPLAANEAAVKLRVDTEGATASLSALAVEDDFAGRLYDAPLDGPDAVYVHRGGAYTAEVRDADGEVGAFRVVPDEAAVTIDRPRTGKASLAGYLAAVAGETRAEVAAAAETDRGRPEDPAIRGLARALAAVVEAAERARERANAGDAAGADERIAAVQRRLGVVAERLTAARGPLPDPLARAAARRLDQADRRAAQAAAAQKL